VRMHYSRCIHFCPITSWSKLIRCQPEKTGLIRRGLACAFWACPH